MKDLTLIIPAKYEKESLPSVLRELDFIKCKKIIILNKYDKETINSISKFLNIKIIKQNNEGYGAALIEGIKKCKTKFFCIFNADGSFNPRELNQMYKKIKNYDFVFASRYQSNSGSDDDSLLTRVGNFIFTKIGKIFFQLPITDILYTFVMGNTKKANSLNLKMHDFSFCVELPIKIHRNNMTITCSSSYERKRIGGQKKVNEFKDGLSILKSIIKLFLFRNA